MAGNDRPYKRIKGRKVLNLENDCSYYFVVIANRLSHGASALYRKKFGVGVAEWRCLVMLALEEGVSAARISEVSGINKSLVSRALARLEELEYVENYHASRSMKPRLLQFTEAGRTLFETMLEHALLREAELRKGLTDTEVSELLRMLKIVLINVEQLDESIVCG